MSKGGSTTQSSAIPQWQTDFMTGTVVPLANQIAQTPFQAYTGNLTQTANPMTTGAGAAYQGVANMTPEQYAAQTAQNFNPYQQSVIDTSLAKMRMDQGQALTGLEQSMIGSGAFGSRGEVARGQFEAQNQAQRDALIASMNQQGFQNAQGLTQQQIANTMAGAGGMQNIGAYLAGLENANQQAEYGQFMREQGYPYQQLAGILGAGQGNYGMTTTTQNNPGFFDWATVGTSLFA